jgi:membrane protease YdiL (CAAX protease family)
MSQLYAITTVSETPPPPRRGRPLLAWLVILAVVGFILWRSSKEPETDKEKYDLTAATMQGRLFVGLEQLQQRFAPKANNKAVLYAQARQALDQHTYAERLRFIVLAGELMGPVEARKQLHRLNEQFRTRGHEPSSDDAETARLLECLYARRERNPSQFVTLPERDREELSQRLGWFGELALTPEYDGDAAARRAVVAPAVRAAIALPLLGVFMLGLAFLGLILFIVLGVLWFLGRLRGGLTVGSRHGGIYAETFAGYMLFFLGLSVAGHFAVERLQVRHGTLALSGLAALASLTALVWPLLRGLSWRQVREDIGWTMGPRPWQEWLSGVGGYALALSMLPAALILILILTKLRETLGGGADEFAPSNQPGHPIVFSLGGGWWVGLEIFFVASIVAPLVEETMFRGVLYRHLRDATSAWRPALSVLVSALTVSFLFAVIHPQGLMAVPALMTLALAFALLREWRVSLVPAMIAHGLNNAVTTALLLLTLS